jgi:hypothetical protein
MVTDAAVTFIICGQSADHSVLPERVAPVVEAGIMPAEMCRIVKTGTRSVLRAPAAPAREGSTHRDMHSKDARAAGEIEQRLYLLDA